MIQFKRFFMIGMAAALFVSLPSCTSSEQPGGDDPTNNPQGSIKLSRLDLSGAKYLTLGTSASSKSSDWTDNVLFKVDENGEVSAVVLECVEEEDGTATTVRKDISVHPREARYLTPTWMFLFDCRFSCDDNEAVWRLHQTYNADNSSFYFNILVNKKTGKLFYIPDAYYEYFTVMGNYDDGSYMPYIDGPNGELYTQTHPTYGLSKITITSTGEAKIDKLGPADMSFFGWYIHLSSNGTVSLIAGNSVTMLYPNNGFETVYESVHDTRDYDLETNFQIMDGKIKAVTLVSEYELDEYRMQTNGTQTITVKEFFPGPTYGTWAYSSPELEISQDVEFQYGSPIGELWDYSNGGLTLHESKNYYFIGSNITALAIEKSTGIITRLTSYETTIVFPDATNQYDGRAWYVYSDCADWFDYNTLERGRVWFDTSGLNNYEIINTTPNIRSGEYMLTAISRLDGKKVVLTIDITTGQVKNVTEVDAVFESITLIPMN